MTPPVLENPAPTRRIPLLIIAGIIMVLMGAAWALQGAYVLPATFMRGPTWVGIGTVEALIGAYVLYRGLRPRVPKRSAS